MAKRKEHGAWRKVFFPYALCAMRYAKIVF
jgi:hypothetical protein